ncbi:MAG: M48 family metalloprotease [Syntrophales bacterium]
MKKVLVILLVLVGCAGRQPIQMSTTTEDFSARMAIISIEVNKCLNTEKHVPYYVIAGNSTNAFTNGEAVFLYEGILSLDDDSIKFTMAHEIAHIKLNHISNVKAASMATTGAMMVVGFIVPGAGLLNHAVNPVVTRSYSRSAELDADRMAVDAMETCMKIPREKIISIFKDEQSRSMTTGGLWSTHPSWDDRIQNISVPR